MDRDDPLEFVRVGVGHRLAPRGDAGVVDQHPDRAEVGHHLFDHGVGRLAVVD